MKDQVTYNQKHPVHNVLMTQSLADSAPWRRVAVTRGLRSFCMCCSATTFPGRTTPLLTSHATFLRVFIPYPSMPTSIWSDLQPFTVIPYSLSQIRISTAQILHVLCPILVHVCSGSLVSFSPFFLHRFILLYLCLLRYPLCICPRFHLAASDYFGLPFFLLRLTVSGMPGL
jgi:hypothetical protein